MMLDNGKVQLPTGISLDLSNNAGQTRHLLFSDKRHGGVRGRVDDYVVPLRAGSTYAVTLPLSQFWSPGTKEFTLHLKPGHYQVTALYAGAEAATHNTGMEWMG